MRGYIRSRRSGWQVQVYLGRDPVSGRRRHLSRQVNGTRREAEAVLAELVAQVSGHQTRHRTTAKDLTLDKLLDRWLEVTDLEESTRYQTRRRLDAYVRPRLGSKVLRRLGAADLDALYAELLRRGGSGGRPLSRSTVRRVHADLSAALGRAVRWGWIGRNPAADAEPPVPRRRRPVAPKPDVVRHLLAVALQTDPALVLFLRLAGVTGARRGELCALRWTDIEWGDEGRPMTVRVERALAHGADRVYEKGTKADDDRRPLALDDVTAALLAEHRKQVAVAALKAGGVQLGPDAFVFSYRSDGVEGWQPSGVTHRFARVRDAAGVDSDVKLRQLRHFVGTQLAAHQVHAVTISGRLGHAKTSTTQDLYTAWLEEPDRQAAAIMGALLDGTG